MFTVHVEGEVHPPQGSEASRCREHPQVSGDSGKYNWFQGREEMGKHKIPVESTEAELVLQPSQEVGHLKKGQQM